MNQVLPSFHRYILIIFILTAFTTQAQTRLSDIDTSRIKQKCIRRFLKSQMDSGIVYFEDFRPSVDEQTDSSRFDFNVHRFHLQQTTAAAWNAYLTAHPAKIWQGKVVSCGFIYPPVSKKIIFSDDSYQGLEFGQIFFIEMRVLFRLIKFPVCFMVTRIDPASHEISFSYIDSGSSKGSQTIKLVDNGKEGTLLLHSSIHQTENVLRDKTLYPIYHRKAIKEVHQNINKILRKR